MKWKDNEIYEISCYLFNRVYGSDDDKEDELILDMVDWQISEFGWEETFESWQRYLLMRPSICISIRMVVK